MSGINSIVIPGVGAPGAKLSILSQFFIQVQEWNRPTYLPEFYGKQSLSFIVLFALIIPIAILPNTQEISNKELLTNPGELVLVYWLGIAYLPWIVFLNCFIINNIKNYQIYYYFLSISNSSSDLTNISET
jgi:hypothetical protein